MSSCYSPSITIQILKYFPSHGVIIRVQVDFDHGVNSVLTPIVVFSSFVEVLKSIIGLSCEPEQQTHIKLKMLNQTSPRDEEAVFQSYQR